MVLLRSFYAVIFFLLLGYIPALAQLNDPEHIFLDSFPMYLEFGYLMGEEYIVGGADRSCKEATIWRLDSNMNIIQKRSLRHKYYERSEVIDMKVNDTAIEVLTYQLRYEDVGGDDGIKWYSLNHDLDIIDSVYFSDRDIYDGQLTDSFWVVKTWRDSLLWISKSTIEVEHSVPFTRPNSLLAISDSFLLGWKENTLLVFDSPGVVDTVEFSQNILDVTFHTDTIFVMTDSQIFRLKKENQLVVLDSIASPSAPETILYHPQASYLIVTTDRNTVHFYDNTLIEKGFVQLFYDPVYEEDLRFLPLEDGSILRLGTTNIHFERENSLLHGQEFGFIQRFDQNYSEDDFERSDLSLESLSLIDPYYDSDEKKILSDTVYIITKDRKSRLRWEISNTGSHRIQSGMMATNILWGFNCAFGTNSHFFTDSTLESGDSLTGEFTIYEIPEFPDGWEADRLLYTAHPNGHYDADFSDNYRSFTLRYIISSSREALDPALVKIWPNPTSDFIHMDLPTDFSFDQVEVIDLYGKKMASLTFPFQSTRIGFPVDFPAGIYFIRLLGSNSHVVKKFMVLE